MSENADQKSIIINQPWHAEAVKLRENGYSKRAIGRLLKKPKTTVQRFFNRLNNAGLNVHAKSKPREPKILLFDLETTPSAGYFWRAWKQNIAPVAVLKHSHILCYAAKWLNEDKLMYDSFRGTFYDILDSEGNPDQSVCESLWSLIDQADIVIAHNGKRFDNVMSNTRWLSLDLPPPSPYKIIDTLAIARREFNFLHNGLDALGSFLKLGNKTQHEGFPLWKKVMKGDLASWDKMEEYVKQDVMLLEKVYLALRAWDKRHPNVSIYYSDNLPRCTVCGSTELIQEESTSKTNVSEFETFRCGCCGKVSRKRKSINRDLHKDKLVGIC